MLDRLPTELLLDISANLTRHDIDRTGMLCKRLALFFYAKTDLLPARQINLHFDDPLVGFRAWQLGQRRHTLKCRLYMLSRVLRGCLVNEVLVSNSTPISNEFKIGFNWFAEILRRHSQHFKGASAYLYPKDTHGHAWVRIIEAAFTGCADFSCHFNGEAGRPSFEEILQHVPLEKCREIDVRDVSGVPPDAIISWLAAPTADLRSITIDAFDASTEALIDQLVIRRHTLRQIMIPSTTGGRTHTPYRDIKVRLPYDIKSNPHFVSVKNRHFGGFIDRVYTYNDAWPIVNNDHVVIKMADRMCVLIIVVCSRPTTSTYDI